MEPISEQEKWFLPKERFLTQAQTGEQPQPHTPQTSNGVHYPTIRHPDRHGIRCQECGANNVTRRCLTCHPLPEDPRIE